mmetsp:Transcript_52824/g.126150  ORF Transcript_52824/g.126150 Transcript_52824/m.126150 type:complete len:1138 (+) Transcript_52824:90-3503(+)
MGANHSDIGAPLAAAIAEEVPVLKMVAKLKHAVDKVQQNLADREDLQQRAQQIQQDCDWVANQICPTLHQPEEQQQVRLLLTALVTSMQHALSSEAQSARRSVEQLDQAHTQFISGLSLVKMRMMSSARNLEAGRSIKYEVETLNPEWVTLQGVIATSNFSVYAADWYPGGPHFGLKVTAAVKVYSAMRMKRKPDDLIRTVTEHTRLQMEATHPNILRIYGICAGSGRVERDEVMVVMPLARMGSLYGIVHNQRNHLIDAVVQREYLASEEELQTAHEKLKEKFTAFKILQDAASALAFVHAQGASHCDMKSGNIIVETEGADTAVLYTAKLIDFDASLIVREDRNPTGPSTTLGGASTPAYRAPELWQTNDTTSTAEIIRTGSRDYLCKADVHSFGIIVYEVVSGRMPFAENPPYAIYEAVCGRHVRPQFDETSRRRDCYDRRAEDLYKRMVSPQASERPGMQEVREQLAQIMEPEVAHIPLGSSLPPPARQPGLPATQPDPEPDSLAEFLTAIGLSSHLQRLRDEGVTEPGELQALTEAVLVKDFQFSQTEARSILEGQASSSASPEDLVGQLIEGGVPKASAERFREHTVGTALNLSKNAVHELLPQTLPQVRFQDWRKRAKANRLVSEDGLWMNDLVQRSHEWCFSVDLDDSATEDDGGAGGVGRVIGFHTSAGTRVGKAPRHAGYCTVRWLRTGYTRSYPMGADGKHALLHADAGAGAGEISPDVAHGGLRLEHLQCTRPYPLGVRCPHLTYFDDNPETCRRVANFKPGDLIRDANGRCSVCVGVKHDAKEGRVQMYFHVDGSEGAGVYDDLLTGNYSKVSTREVQQFSADDWEGDASDAEIDHDERAYVAKNIRPSLRLKVRSGIDGHFDPSSDLVERFGLKCKSGDLLQDRHDGQRMICVGVARQLDLLPPGAQQLAGVLASGLAAEHPGVLRPDLWFWVEGSLGAGVNRAQHKCMSRWEVTGRVVLRDGENPWDQIAPMPPKVGPTRLRELLKLDFKFPTGERPPAEDRDFDIRESVVCQVINMRPGTVLRFEGRCLILIGIARSQAEWQIWFYEPGDAGATVVQYWECLLPQLVEHMRPTERVDLRRLREQIRAGSVAADALPLLRTPRPNETFTPRVQVGCRCVVMC